MTEKAKKLNYWRQCDLSLDRIVRNEDGTLKEARVVNGAWWLRRAEGQWCACDDYGNIVTMMGITEEPVLEEAPGNHGYA